MSYKTYITDAIVCGAFNNLTSDRAYLLFTRDAGMLYATAKSVREERSKHRYSLQEFSHVRITLVRGKMGWRIIGTESLGNFYTTLASRDARASLRNTIRLLRRIMHGEVAYPTLFDDVVKGFSYLSVCGDTLETLLSLRILYTLGYVADIPELSLPIHTPIERVFSLVEDTHIHLCRVHIVRALTESHL